MGTEDVTFVADLVGTDQRVFADLGAHLAKEKLGRVVDFEVAMVEDDFLLSFLAVFIALGILFFFQAWRLQTC